VGAVDLNNDGNRNDLAPGTRRNHGGSSVARFIRFPRRRRRLGSEGLIGKIREALGDDAAPPRFVRTIQRLGYAFRGRT
jgi:hypothetical protein